MSIEEAHDKLRFTRITTRNAEGHPVLKSDLPNYEEYDPIVALCEYEDTLLSPTQINKLFPHICANCIGCEYEPADGHGCDGHDQFVLSIQRGYGRLLERIEEEQRDFMLKLRYLNDPKWNQMYDTCINQCGCGIMMEYGKIACWNTVGCKYGISETHLKLEDT